MGKAMYSLILSEEIVDEIDRLAARQGCSRSALVNHILAEHTSLSTPEKRLRDTWAVVEEAMEGQLRSAVTSGGMLTLHTALRYKYNPQLSYLLELTPGEETFGRLRVGLRSRNQALLVCLQLFFELWNRMEQRHLPNPPPARLQAMEPQRYLRALRRPARPCSDEEAGEALAAYVSLLDDCLKAFFNRVEHTDDALAAARAQYLQGLPGLGLAADF